MRLCGVILLAVVILFAAGAEALSTSEQTKTTKTTDVKAPQWDRSITDTANCLLRNRSTTNEERAFSMTALAKKFGGKLKRLAKYNYWIFTGKKPQDVKDAKYMGYWNFYHDRMTPGGKYY